MVASRPYSMIINGFSASAHALPEDKETLSVVFAITSLATTSATSGRAARLLDPSKESIVRLSSVEAPATAHSNELGGFYRRVENGTQSGLDFVPCLYVEPLNEQNGKEGVVKLHYPIETETPAGIETFDVCRNIDVASKLLSGDLLGEGGSESAPAEAPAPGEEGFEDFDAPSPIIWRMTTPNLRAPPPAGRPIGLLRPSPSVKTMALREYLGEAVDETTGMMRPVPPIALNTDRLFQRAVASLLFARQWD